MSANSNIKLTIEDIFEKDKGSKISYKLYSKKNPYFKVQKVDNPSEFEYRCDTDTAQSSACDNTVDSSPLAAFNGWQL